VVLVQAPLWGVGVPPLGIALLKSYLKQNGIDSKVMDINIRAFMLRGAKYKEYWEVKNGWNHVNNPEEMIEFYENYRALFSYYIDEIGALQPKIVGLTVYYSNAILTDIFAAELKQRYPDISVVLGGPNVAEYMGNKNDLLQKDHIDAVCLDEGEKALLAYCKAVFLSNLEPLPGIAYKVNGEVIDAESIDYIRKLDELPFPDFDDFDIQAYSTSDDVHLPSYVSRGCVNKCIYCNERNFMKKFRYRSAKRVLEEFEYIKSRYPEATHIRMCDSISNANVRMLNEFCDLMIEKKVPLRWNLENAVIRKEMRKPLYKKLKKAGCTLIGYGMETPSQDLLKNIGKTLAVGVDLVSILKEGKQAGLVISVNVMFGLPGETDKDFYMLVDFLRKNRKSLSMVNPSINFCAFYPGSFGYHDPSKYGIDVSNGPDFWRSTDNTNTFPIRMQRFEKFVENAKKYKLDNFFNTSEVPNKYQMLFDYYWTVNEIDNALDCYQKIPVGDLKKEQINKYNAIVSGNHDIEQIDYVSDYLESNIRDTDNRSQNRSVGWLMNNFISEEIYNQNEWYREVHPLKYRLRKMAHKIIGVGHIEQRINGVVELAKIAGTLRFK